LCDATQRVAQAETPLEANVSAYTPPEAEADVPVGCPEAEWRMLLITTDPQMMDKKNIGKA